MRTNQVHLQLAHLLRGNSHAGQLAESRIDSVCGVTIGQKFFDHRARSIHASNGVRRNLYGHAVQDHGVKLRKGEIVAGQQNAHASLRSGREAAGREAAMARNAVLYFSGKCMTRPSRWQEIWVVSPVANSF